jgi:hypothetical protein
VLAAQVVTSCGDDSGGGGCEPGEINGCNCSAAETGEQVCQANRTYTECDCDGTAGGNGGDGGSAGNASMAGSAGMGGGTPEPIIPVGLIGAPCTSDADCSDAVDTFKCILSTSNAEFAGLGGPEGGYCTVPCRDTDECSALDGASACGLIDDVTGEGFCIALCLAGNNPQKCGDGSDFRAQACVENETAAPVGACFPFCTSDAGCGSGRFCALGGDAAGLCVDTAPVGGGIGVACDPEGEGAECASGICLTFSNTAGVAQGGFCSASCTFGAQFGCGYAPGTPETTPRDTFCLQAQLDDGRPGDLGLCFEVCDVDADCVQGDWVCDAFGSPDLQTLLGRLGQCVPASLSNDGAADAGPG